MRKTQNFPFTLILEFDVCNSSLMHTICLIRDDSLANLINLDSSSDYNKRPVHFMDSLLDFAKPKDGIYQLTPLALKNLVS